MQYIVSMCDVILVFIVNFNISRFVQFDDRLCFQSWQFLGIGVVYQWITHCENEGSVMHDADDVPFDSSTL